MSTRAVAGDVERDMASWSVHGIGSGPKAPGCCGYGDPSVAVEAYQFAQQETGWLTGVLHRLECEECGGSKTPCVEWVLPQTHGRIPA